MIEPIQLNEFGCAVWWHKENRNLFAERPYYWCDRIIVLDEAGDGRQVINDTRFSTFDFSDWIPMTVEQYNKVRHQYKEIHN